MIMSDMPVPERTEVYLMPELHDRSGRPLRARRPTKHRYSYTEERIEYNPDATPGVEGSERIAPDVTYVHIFTCVETGAQRVYGCEGTGLESVLDSEED